MGTFYDTVPLSAIVRIRDMMYTVKDPFRLDQGDVSFDAPDSFKNAVHKALDDNHTHYLPTTGLPRLRQLLMEKIQAKNGIPIGSPEDVQVTNGGTHAIYAAMHALLEPGDEVIVPDPEWPPTMAIVIAARGVPVPVPLHEGLGWRWDLDELERAITPKTKALYINSPNNPTGGILTRADLERLAAIAREREPVGVLRRGLRGHGLRRRAREHRLASRHVRSDDPALHVQQDLRGDRCPGRLLRDQGSGDSRPRAQGGALHHEQRQLAGPVRRDRRARGIAAVHRGLPAGAEDCAATCSTTA